MTLQQQYLEAMGIECWQRRDLPLESQPVATVIEAVPVVEAPVTASPIADVAKATPVAKAATEAFTDVSTMDWTALHATVTSCTQCGLHSTQHQPIPGTGNQQANWMIIGGAPSQAEAQHGEPFVDAAGQLLNAMLAAIDLKRDQVYLTNLLKCQLETREPNAEEVASCESYLLRQVELIQPSLILVMGAVAAQHILKSAFTAIDTLRGTAHCLPGTDIPLVVTYHPSDLLRRPADKRKAWQDLQQAQAIVAQTI
jgi:uracil-DNA glycosylase family 4